METIAEPPRTRRGRSALARIVPAEVLPATAWLLLAIVLPAAVFLVYSFWSSDIFGIHHDWNVGQYRTALGDGFYRRVILATLELGVLVSVVCVALAYGTAYALTFSLRRYRHALLLVIVGTALASYLVRIYAWLVILGPNGPINRGLEWLGVISAPLSFLLYSKFSVVTTLVCVLVPFAVLPIYASMQSVDQDLLRASRDLGAGPIVSFVRIVLPLTWPGCVIALLLTFVLTVGDYVTPELVGGTGGIMVGRVIYDQFVTRDWAFASALAFSLIGVVVVLLGLAFAASRLVRRSAVRVQPRNARRRLARGPIASLVRRVPWAASYIGAIVVFVLGPVLLVAVFSFSSSAFAAFPIRGLSLHWYRAALTSADFRSALGTSLRVALASTVLALALGLPASFGLVRRRFALRGLLTSATLLPLSLPGIVIGMALLTGLTYVGVGLSSSTAVIGQATLALPLVVLVLSARLRGFDRSLEEAARDLGCHRRDVLRRVTVPLLLPTVVAVAVLAFAVSMDEFVVTNFIIGGDQTLPVLVWALFQRQGISPIVNAIATMLLVGTMVVLGVLVTLSRLRAQSVPRDLLERP